MSITVHCDAGACLGTFSGEVSVRIANTHVHVHGEGNRVAALGSTDGACDTHVDSGDVEGLVYARERMPLGNEHSRVVITGGNFRLVPEGSQTPVSPAGLPLFCQTPPGDHFEQVCRDKRSTWTYVADRNAEGQLLVWLPR